MNNFTKKTFTKKILSALLALTILSAAGCDTADYEYHPVSETTNPEHATDSAQRTDAVLEDAAAAGAREPEAEKSQSEKPQSGDVETAGSTIKEFQPLKLNPSVAEYEVLPDLSNVKNISDFSFLTDRQRELLAKNHFVVAPSDNRQMYYLYESNDHENIPNFITVDSVLHTHHILYDYILRTCESQKFLPGLEQLTGEMVMLTLDAMTVTNDPIIGDRLVNVLAYFCTAEMLLGNMLPPDVPEEALETANEEYNLIKTQSERAVSPLTGRQVDYSIFKPWGHYTHSEDLRRYFEVSTLYGTMGLPFFDEDGEFITYQTIDSLIITNLLFSSPEASRLWKNIYDTSVFFTGDPGDMTPERLHEILEGIYGDNPQPDSFSNAANLDTLRQRLSKQQFCFMGRRHVPDTEIFEGLTEPLLRPIPSGLDVFAVLGNGRAAAHLEKFYRPSAIWGGYSDAFSKMKRSFGNIPEKTWQSDMYYGWFWILKAMPGGLDEGYPMFMKSEAWQDKSLMSALGSWTELRRHTRLHAKPGSAETASGAEETLPHYVEPNVAVYERLLYMTEVCREYLLRSGIFDDGLKERMVYFENQLKFLIDCSVKELTGEPLNDEDLTKLHGFGDRLKEITLSCAMPGSGYTSDVPGSIFEPDMNMATIGDVYSTPASYLEEAVGYASAVYVITPSEGELYLTRGAVFDYYEFESPTRLTQDDWRDILAAGGAPPRPKWTAGFISE